MSQSRHDPVCAAQVKSQDASHVEFAGTAYFFCSEQCARAFARDPERYVSSIDGVLPRERVPVSEAEREHFPDPPLPVPKPRSAR